jgi:simple sugar transport system ATP-binding protein
VPVAEATVEKIGEWMSGLWEGSGAAAAVEVAHG